MNYELKTLVKETCKLQCIRLHDGKMAAIYETETSGFKFPVPVAEMQNGTFNAEERGFVLMKWLRGSLALLNADEPEAAPVAPAGVVVDLTK